MGRKAEENALGRRHWLSCHPEWLRNPLRLSCGTHRESFQAGKREQLQDALLTYTHPHILLIDEIGYLTYGLDAANVLFHVVNHRHLKKRPMIFTTNKPLSESGRVLHDEDLAAAILDRVLERGRFIQLDGPSGRTRHLNLEEVWPATAERLRISGTHIVTNSDRVVPHWHVFNPLSHDFLAFTDTERE
jgi:hypothetical protein